MGTLFLNFFIQLTYFYRPNVKFPDKLSGYVSELKKQCEYMVTYCLIIFL